MKASIDPWDVKEVKDYYKLMQDLGVDNFSRFPSQLKNSPLPLRRGLVIGHKDFSKILGAIQKKEAFAILTGLMPSGCFHFGHMSVIQQVIYYQKLGAKIYLVAADIEAMLTREFTKEQARKTAIEEYLLNYLALGLSTKNLKFYFQSEGGREYNNLSKLASAKTTFNEVKNIYGAISPAKLVSALTQAADILLPQQEGTPLTLTPVGFDQLPHANFTRDIASRMNFALPAFTFHKLVPGLQGVTTKMSSSKPESYIAFTDDERTIAKKINKYAFSGGQSSIAEHRKKGGNPDIDVSFQWLNYLFEEDDKKLNEIYNNYKSGSLLTWELKAILIDKITLFLKHHNQQKEKAGKELDKILDN
ncbi:MAG TPA: tryptophan--tRNA ligase [Candidatus Nanoarchaeia archaeon]|nr:tryptophan--tRNA ligase [Candidatus Nanoarchaeia archaeon]